MAFRMFTSSSTKRTVCSCTRSPPAAWRRRDALVREREEMPHVQRISVERLALVSLASAAKSDSAQPTRASPAGAAMTGRLERQATSPGAGPEPCRIPGRRVFPYEAGPPPSRSGITVQLDPLPARRTTRPHSGGRSRNACGRSDASRSIKRLRPERRQSLYKAPAAGATPVAL